MPIMPYNKSKMPKNSSSSNVSVNLVDFQLQPLLAAHTGFGWPNFGEEHQQMFKEDNMQIQRFAACLPPLQWAFIDEFVPANFQ